jgi:hypothetical protein
VTWAIDRKLQIPARSFTAKAFHDRKARINLVFVTAARDE